MSWLEGNYKQARDGDGDYKAMMISAKNHPGKNPQTLEVVEKRVVTVYNKFAFRQMPFLYFINTNHLYSIEIDFNWCCDCLCWCHCNRYNYVTQ